MHQKLIVGLVALAVMMYAHAATALTVVDQGRPVAVIVVPEKAHPVVIYAAEELQWHLEKISGATVAIAAENELDQRPEQGVIYLGQTQAAIDRKLVREDLPANAYVLSVDDKAMHIVGHDTTGEPLDNMTGAGTLFGVYDLLESQLGVRWLWPGELGTHTPTSRTVMFESTEASPRLPALKFSQFRAEHASGGVGRTLEAWQSKEAGETYYREQARWLRRHRFGIGTQTRLIATDTRVFHTFLNYWKNYGEEHPEYFNLLPDGTRREHPGRKRGGPAVTLCVSEPGLWKQIVEDWRNNWRGRMGVHVRLGENDSPALCTCERCRSWDAPDPRFKTSDYWSKGMMYEDRSPFLIHSVVGNSVKWGWHGKLGPDPAPSVSDRYARFYLEVQREAEKYQPGVMVAGFAYLNYWHAPKKPIQLNDRIVISFVPPTRIPYTEALSQEIRDNWQGWRKTGVQLYLRPNLPSTHIAPLLYGHRFFRDLKFFGENGMIGNDYDSLSRGHFGTQGPSLYALARGNSLPELTAEEVLDEYYQAFGPAAAAVRDYFTYWEQVSEVEVEIGGGADMIGVVGDDEVRQDPLADVPQWVKLYHETLTPEVINEGRRLLEQVRKAAAESSDPQVRERVAYLVDAYQDVDLTRQMIHTFIEFHKSGQKNEQLKDQFKIQREQVLAHRAGLEHRLIGNYGARQQAENYGFRSIMN